jgi:hypothetical protein
MSFASPVPAADRDPSASLLTAVCLVAAMSLSTMALATEPEEASQPTEDHAATPASTSDAKPAAPDSTEASSEPAEMSPSEAAQAAIEGKIDYADEKIDPHKATAAEIAAHNATAAPDDRVICRREQLTGSHRKTKVCMTVGQRRALMEQTQEGLATSGRNGAGNLNGLEPAGG